MTEEEKLQKAYFVLGLEPGAPLDKITRRHKRLIMVWHPDRFPTEEGKKDAEEELKQINNAKDDLKNHFEKSHKASGACACKPSPDGSAQSSNQGSTRSGQGPGPGKRKTTQETNRQEAEAQRRSREREQKAAEAAAEKERQRRAAASAAAAQQTAQQAADQTKLLEDERLRWKVTLCIGATWIGLSLFGCIGTTVKHWWHDVSWKWQNEHSTTDTKPPDVGTSTGTSTNTVTTYIPPYYQTPGGNPTTWQPEQQQRDQEQKDRDQKQHDQDVYFTKLEIDKWQKSIDHSTTTIANLEAQIANPSVSDPEKNKLRDYQDYQRKCLAEAQVNLKAAQDKLAGLTGESPSQTTPSISSPLNGNPGIPLVPIPSNNNSSPFAPAADPNASPTTGTSTSLSDMMKKYNLDKLTTPSTTTGTDSSSTTTGTTFGGTNSFFNTQKAQSQTYKEQIK
ncbi:MAG TPA: DnaJ domain-containing protein [Candidatus Obscuribacter sp.]|nr:DnaJ domain-containing protein [Candidatus Melainabacteria bacterium]HNG19335.1 DnaJ domain-containing protein [Candidatus Obscuribacter sp.]HNG74849.1 DnaJ domain-containing protein [Candidatus Obscuribacter sp.]HNH76510.1 DnaJ domain-containing protein [Candidatus Obscuribacter sp.]